MGGKRRSRPTSAPSARKRVMDRPRRRIRDPWSSGKRPFRRSACYVNFPASVPRTQTSPIGHRQPDPAAPVLLARRGPAFALDAATLGDPMLALPPLTELLDGRPIGIRFTSRRLEEQKQPGIMPRRGRRRKIFVHPAFRSASSCFWSGVETLPSIILRYRDREI